MDPVDEWIKDHCYAEDDIVLGSRGLLEHQAVELRELLDLARPGWRELLEEAGLNDGS